MIRLRKLCVINSVIPAVLAVTKDDRRKPQKIARIWSSLKLLGGQGRQNLDLGKVSIESKNKTASNEFNYKKSHKRISPQQMQKIYLPLIIIP